MVSTFSSYLQESGLSRIWKHSEEHDYGTITANRYAPDCDKEHHTPKRKINKETNLYSRN